LLDLDAERIDIAIRQGRGMYANCESIKLADCEYVAVCPAHLQKHSSTLPLITVDWPVHMADAPKWPSWLELNPNIEFGERRSIGVSIESMAIRAALAGQGLALVDRFYVQSELRNGELVEAFPGSNALQLSYAHFLVRPNGLARPSAESLWQWLLQKFSEFR
jgi:LysR family glycine cleavage system transcriptional activator